MGAIQFVFLDRDGVINRKLPEGKYIAHPRQVELLPGAANAIARLNAAGCTVIVVTNQRGIALGRYTGEDLHIVHQYLQQELNGAGAHIDAFYFCPHDENECSCRKPKTGLFERAFADFPGAEPANSVLIGDSLSDIEAGRTLALRSYFIRGGAGTRKPGSETAERIADAAFDSLGEAVTALF